MEYEWPFYLHFPALLPGLLTLGLLLLKSNRNRKAWLALVPVALGMALFHLPFKLFAAIGVGSGAAPFNADSLLLGLAALWLLGDFWGRISGRKAALAAMLIIAAFATIEALMQSGGIMALLFTIPLSCGTVLTLILAAYWSRRRYSGLFYVVMLFCACLLIAFAIAVLSLAIMLIMYMSAPVSIHFVWSMLIGLPVFTGIGGTALFALLLPFVLLALNCRFYHRRFMTALRIVNQSADPAPESASSPPPDM